MGQAEGAAGVFAPIPDRIDAPNYMPGMFKALAEGSGRGEDDVTGPA